MAFFDARLMLVKDPETQHQQAQIKTYDTLRQIFQSKLLEQRHAQQSQSGQTSERRAVRS